MQQTYFFCSTWYCQYCISYWLRNSKAVSPPKTLWISLKYRYKAINPTENHLIKYHPFFHPCFLVEDFLIVFDIFISGSYLISLALSMENWYFEDCMILKITMAHHGQKVEYEIYSSKCFQWKIYFLSEWFF